MLSESTALHKVPTSDKSNYSSHNHNNLSCNTGYVCVEYYEILYVVRMKIKISLSLIYN